MQSISRGRNTSRGDKFRDGLEIELRGLDSHDKNSPIRQRDAGGGV
jgi:hypothetical protein